MPVFGMLLPDVFSLFVRGCGCSEDLSLRVFDKRGSMFENIAVEPTAGVDFLPIKNSKDILKGPMGKYV